MRSPWIVGYVPEPTFEDIEAFNIIINKYNISEGEKAHLMYMLSSWSQCAGIAQGVLSLKEKKEIKYNHDFHNDESKI